MGADNSDMWNGMAVEKELRDNLVKAINEASNFPDIQVRKKMLMDALLYIATRAGVSVEMNYD